MASPYKRKRRAIFAAIIFLGFIAPSISQDGDEESPGDDEDYSNCNLPYLGSNDAKNVPEGLFRMGPNSKYFLATGQSMQIKEVTSFCEGLGLQPAEIRSHLELIAVESFFVAIGVDKTIAVSLGINDEQNEGEFKEYDGSPMKFHSFADTQPDNKMNVESCVVVTNHPVVNRMVYMDLPCDSQVTPMCMFKTSDRCFLSSPLSMASSPGGFSYVGSSPLRDYFVGRKQVPRSQARVECDKMGYMLVDFNTGLANNQRMYELLKRWMGIHSLFPLSAFWTGGKIVTSINPDMVDAGPSYHFETSGKALSDLSDWPSLTWEEGEPFDNSGIGKDECVTAILRSDYNPSGNQFTLSTMNCKIPFYPLCYKNKLTLPGKVDSTDEEGTTPEPEITKKYCPLDNIEVNLTSVHLTYLVRWKLSVISRLRKLGSDEFRFQYLQERPWLSDFLDIIFRTGRKAGQEDLVPYSFANIIHNMVILYYNAVNDAILEPSEQVLAQIQNETKFFYNCMEHIEPLKFETAGGLPRQFMDESIRPIPESVESKRMNVYMDMVLDSLWFYFQTAVGSCYARAPSSKTEWLYKIHHLFVKYFMNPFHDRWLVAGTSNLVEEYGIFFGDIDIESTFYSLRINSIAAFTKSMIPDLYFPRPLYIPSDHNIRAVMNVKLI